MSHSPWMIHTQRQREHLKHYGAQHLDKQTISHMAREVRTDITLTEEFVQSLKRAVPGSVDDVIAECEPELVEARVFLAELEALLAA
ncbi:MULTISPECIES: hypothetical protein [Methylobacterium]|uniref:Uncharacterized protein n=1 Tax=Methylobacterium jeotgali TaxID=381630 RepID=A0ABQ4SUI0_9HYPH|nr:MULTISPECIES: hypothetical protein [Methylobacterium]PIU05690.1 MAG: hypothetical protein COT56_13680 [Methylobacterium sp. CG09_land_8_20_14_0_10_71_15]PIU12400.1 MAG: hypothetical protein COT28_15525 [Methylobacterium sp. CG08_land_8_20_14_0_20_71_15]GBU16915.1 hypothetical protein AwMethylo_11300 [Methylobacterium sp.]GJE06869.1 hypothetical protein AOPFMNJM_2191 [Methylobacterium jeotgali]